MRRHGGTSDIRRDLHRTGIPYATGQESDRTLAAWLNAKGARTARERLFSKDTVREMLCNAAYAGHVSGLRDTSRSCMSRSSAMSWTPAQPLEERLRDLYAMGDITKPMYVMQRQVLEEELRRAKPPIDPDLDRAQTILEDFSRFWDAEPEPAE